MTENEITYKIRHAIFDVYNELGPGLLESVYQEAMTYQMRIDGLKVDEQVSVPVIYKGQLLQKADLKLDLLVEGCVIIELKSVAEMKNVFFKQLQTYLKLSKLHCGILVNFNTDNIIDSIHRVFNGYK